METYREKLEREVNEIKKSKPEIEKIISLVKQQLSRSNMDFDYAIEPVHSMYKGIRDILNTTIG